MLPSAAGGAVTNQVGFFEIGSKVLADWIQAGLDEMWVVQQSSCSSLDDAVSTLVPNAAVTRYLCVPFGIWSVLLNNSPLGTDVGVLPSYAARELGCRSMRASNIDDDATYPARILEVYGPGGEPPLALERSVFVAKDGGRWVFETSGTPYSFEDQEAYKRRIKATRFSSVMLFDYLRALGVPLDATPRWADAVMVQRL